MGLAKIEWELRADDAARALEEKFAVIGCNTVGDLLSVDFDERGGHSPT